MIFRLLRYIDENFEESLVIAFQIIMTLCLTYSAIVRYFLTLPFFTSLSHKAEELGLFSFIALLYFGAAIAMKKNGHFRITAHFLLLPARWRAYAFIPGELLWQGFNLFIVYQGWILVRTAIDIPEPSLSLGIPMWLIYFIIPMSFALMFVRLLQRHCLKKFGVNAQELPDTG